MYFKYKNIEFLLPASQLYLIYTSFEITLLTSFWRHLEKIFLDWFAFFHEKDRSLIVMIESLVPPFHSLETCWNVKLPNDLKLRFDGIICFCYDFREAMMTQPGNVVTEMTSAYKKRVVEETEETSTM